MHPAFRGPVALARPRFLPALRALLLLSAAAAPTFANPEWTGADLGSAATPGTTTADANTLTLTSSATGWTTTSDAFHFHHTASLGDFSLRVRRDAASASLPEASAGLMVRADAASLDAPFAFLGLSPSAGLVLQTRASASASVSSLSTPDLAPPLWLRLDRHSDRLDAYVSSDGSAWTYLSSPRLDLSVTLSLGLAAHGDGAPAHAAFSSLSLAPVPGPRGLWAEYYSTTALGHAPALTRTEAALDLPSTPAPEHGLSFPVGAARWSGSVQSEVTATHAFALEATGSVRVWLDDQKVLDVSAAPAGSRHEFTAALSAGLPRSLVVEHVAPAGSTASAQLLWSRPGLAERLVPPDNLLPLDPLLDTDGDDIPDYWEKRHGLDPLSSADAALDRDGDHLTNLQEFRAGTSPLLTDSDGDGLPDGRGAPGLVLWERWADREIVGLDIADFRRFGLYPAQPTTTRYLSGFEIPPANYPRWTGSRLRAWVVAPSTGAYRFYVTGEYRVELFLGTTASTTDKQRIAYVNGTAAYNHWTATPVQASAEFTLVAGQRYYLELLTKSEGQRSLAQAGWRVPGSSAITPIPASALVAFGAEDDADDDRLPDSWELARFGNLSASPDADPDGDGLNHLQESRLGTDPLAPASAPGGQPDTALAVGHLTYDYGLDVEPGTASAFVDSPRYLSAPDGRVVLSSSREPANLAQNYAGILRGHLVVPESGSYAFKLLDSYGECAFYLGTTDQPSSKVRLLTNAGTSVTRSLVAGQSYYFEAVRKAGTATAPLTLHWKPPGASAFGLVAPSALRPLVSAGIPRANTLPAGWQATSLGRNLGWLQHPAFTSWDSAAGRLTLRASGHKAELHSDDATLVHQTLAADGQVTVRLASLLGAPATTQAGLMIRQDLGPGAAQVMIAADRTGALVASARARAHDRLVSLPSVPSSTPVWLRLVRRAGWVYAYTSADGAAWHWLAEFPVPFAGPVYAGPFAASGSPAQLGHAVFEQLDLAPDSDGDGILDRDELAGAAVTVDTDGDGYSDHEETHYLHSDPLVADLQPAQPVVQLAGAAGQPALGQWAVKDGDIYHTSIRGSVTYAFTLAQPGVHRLALTVRPRANSTADTRWDVLAALDGQPLGTLRYTLELGQAGTGFLYTPWLPAGAHTLTLTVDNVSLHRTLALAQVALERIPGADLDGDGVADWQPARLVAQNSLANLAFSSRSSPFCLEGRAAYLATLSLLADGEAVAPLAAVGDGWYADIPLDPEAPVALQARFENGGHLVARELVWTPTNVLGGGEVLVRAGDALLLEAAPAGATAGSATLEISRDGQVLATHVLAPGERVAHAFAEPGDYVVSASYADGSVQADGSLAVRALAAAFSAPDPVVALGHAREWQNPALPAEAVVETDGRMEVAELAPPPAGGRAFRLRIDAPDTRRVAARLPDGTGRGPILDVAAISGVRAASGADTGIYYADQFADGTHLVEMRVVVFPLPPDLRVKFEIFVAGVTFEDGSTVKWFTAEDFDATGQLKVRFLRAPGVTTSVCHRLYLYQGDTLLETRFN